MTVPALFGRSRRLLASILLSLVLLLGFGTPAQAFDNPQLLPEQPTPIIDLAKVLTDTQEQRLASELDQFEQETGWKLRVLTQFDQTPGLAVKTFWGLDERSLLLVADQRGGNLLNFNVGDALYALMPRTYWVELQTRFGNQFYVRDHGEDGAIIDALHVVEDCLRDGGCSVVPGLPQEQWVLTLITSILGGLVCGFAAHPRKPGEIIAWQWILIFSPLWGILFVAFGIGPVVSRTHEFLPISRNVLGFLGAAVAAYLVYQIRQGNQPTSES